MHVNGSIDASSVGFEVMKLFWRESCNGAVGSGTELQGALDAVVFQQGGTNDFGQFASCVTAQKVHLEEAVLGGDKALRKDEVVERGGTNVWHATRIALNGDWLIEAVNGQFSVYLWKRGRERVLDPTTCSNECSEQQDKQDADEYGRISEDTARCMRGFVRFAVGASGDQRRFWSRSGKAHCAMQSLNVWMART